MQDALSSLTLRKRRASSGLSL
ncbi:hypothetical protein NOCARDAX2BIS_220152 [Nocardioides sp. AX2bis]|nr:hypothetical protein NOCARDAX2BIS_220152 [Nocardioides sp. AX2bis]